MEKKFLKKWTLVASSVVAMSLLLAGCGNEGDSTKSSGGSEVANTELRMSWWGNDDRHQSTLAALEKYHEKNLNVKIKGEYSGFGNLEETIITQMAGQTEADIITLLYNWVTKFSPDGEGFYDLNTLSNELDLSQFDKEFLEFGMSNGKLNAIPVGKNTQVIVLNKSVFDDLGLAIPQTWEDYVEAAEKFPEGSFPLVAPTPRFMATIYLQQKTGKSEFDESGNMNYTEEDYKDAMKWYKDMVDAKVLASRQDYLENVGTEPVSLAQNAKYINGKYAGVLEWNGGLASYEATLVEQGQELVVAPIPEIEGAKTTGTIKKPTMLFAISKNSKSPEEAAKVINFLLNDPEGIKALGVSRGVPESKIAVEILKAEGEISGIIKESMEYANEVEGINETPIYEDGTFTAIFQQQMENYEFGKSDLDTAAKDLYTQTKKQAEKLTNNQ